MADEVNISQQTTEVEVATNAKPSSKATAKLAQPVIVNADTLASPVAGKETFSREYVSELREENQAWKQKYEKTLAELEKTRQDTQVHLTQTQQAANERIIRAELKAHALKAGLIDMDDLKLADLSKVTLQEDGTVAGAQQMLATLKEAKPYLFGLVQQSSSYAETPPNPKPSTAESVQDLPREAYEKRKAAYLRSR